MPSDRAPGTNEEMELTPENVNSELERLLRRVDGLNFSGVIKGYQELLVGNRKREFLPEELANLSKVVKDLDQALINFETKI
ncbi:MAG: hypothetical protein KJ915_04460 [Candidatus Omnitrophica bacterium]|nr:hypothetical protein [Candidatus Omnitrophota bacterium]